MHHSFHHHHTAEFYPRQLITFQPHPQIQLLEGCSGPLPFSLAIDLCSNACASSISVDSSHFIPKTDRPNLIRALRWHMYDDQNLSPRVQQVPAKLQNKFSIGEIDPVTESAASSPPPTTTTVQHHVPLAVTPNGMATIGAPTSVVTPELTPVGNTTASYPLSPSSRLTRSFPHPATSPPATRLKTSDRYCLTPLPPACPTLEYFAYHSMFRLARPMACVDQAERRTCREKARPDASQKVGTRSRR